MPKRTSEFREMQDYKEAVVGKQKGQAFFGHRGDLAQYYTDINDNQERSEIFGRVLYPESAARRRINGGVWDYEKNKAFWAGAIDSGQTFVLVSDIGHYRASGGTVDEIFWLQDNGYHFQSNPHNLTQTIAVPPQIPVIDPYIRDYNTGYGPESEPRQERLQRLDTIRANILQQRAMLSQKTTPSQH